MDTFSKKIELKGVLKVGEKIRYYCHPSEFSDIIVKQDKFRMAVLKLLHEASLTIGSLLSYATEPQHYQVRIDQWKNEFNDFINSTAPDGGYVQHFSRDQQVYIDQMARCFVLWSSEDFVSSLQENSQTFTSPLVTATLKGKTSILFQRILHQTAEEKFKKIVRMGKKKLISYDTSTGVMMHDLSVNLNNAALEYFLRMRIFGDLCAVVKETDTLRKKYYYVLSGAKFNIPEDAKRGIAKRFSIAYVDAIKLNDNLQKDKLWDDIIL